MCRVAAHQHASSRPASAPMFLRRQRLSCRRPKPAALAFPGFPTATVAPSTAETTNYLSQELGWRTDFNNVYLRGRLIGAGSFGQVHLGIHQESGMEVAIKTLPKIRGKLSREKTLGKISRETDMLQRLQSNPGVIRLLECFEDTGSVQIVTELCAGGDLQKFVEVYGSLDEASLALVAYEVLLIVKACHQLGILHGDVKPANFCLKGVKKNLHKLGSPEAGLKAIDFGCSQFLGARRLSKRTGTPVFMAPEIFGRDYAEAADVWAVGVMLYWLYCRRFPVFENVEQVKQAKLEEVAHAVANAPIPYDFGPWKGLSEEGLDLISRCLTRPEDERITVDEALEHPWLQRYVQARDAGLPLVPTPPAAKAA